MPTISETHATLRLFGDELDPAEITRLLGSEPSESGRKGELVRRRTDGTERRHRQGNWRLQSKIRAPGDLDAQIAELLNGLTGDLAVWRDLARNYQIDVFCGLFMEDINEGISLKPHTLKLLGDRELTVDFDIYGAGSPGDEQKRPPGSTRSG